MEEKETGLKAQRKTVTLDWPARWAAKHTTEEEIYLSGKHNFLRCFHFSVKHYTPSPISSLQSHQLNF
jgi:hypothetical protein